MREIVQELAVDFGWIVAFSQIVLHVGISALMTLTAAARLMFALETNGINNVYPHHDLAYASKHENSQYQLITNGDESDIRAECWMPSFGFAI
jgi:hypothetical protein